MIFTAEEQKIRRRWLITLLCLIPYDIIMSGIGSLNSPEPMEFFLALALLQLALTGLVYYFTYKKNGHRLLFGSLMATLASLQRGISQNNFPSLNGNAEVTAFIVMLVISFGIKAWWFFISFKIIDIHRSLNPSRKCKKAMASMHNAQSTQDLDRHFQMLKEEFPKYERAIATAYQEKKNSLLATSSPN